MKLLIVDDIPANLKILKVLFEDRGHTTIQASDGIEALQVLRAGKVDAVLTDVLMPRMDGYRLCHEIRTDDRLRDLPIVIYTATYTALSDEELALSVGADRYLKKPAPFHIILAALHAAMDGPRETQRREPLREVEVLKEYSDRLVAKLEQKNRELAEANERLTLLERAKNDFLCVISHEFRTPLFGLSGAGELLFAAMPKTQENEELQNMFTRSRNRISCMLEDALLLTRIDVERPAFNSSAVSLSVVLNRAIQAATEFAKWRDVGFAMLPADLGPIVGEPDLLIRSFVSLLETAVKFSKKGDTVHLAHQVVDDTIKVIIDSQSWTISATAMPKFFDVFSIGETLTPGGDLGLGTAVANRILSLFGGSVSVANRDPSGIRLTVSLKSAA